MKSVSLRKIAKDKKRKYDSFLLRKKGIAAALALILPAAAIADTVSTSGTLSGTNPRTRAPSISSGTITTFNSYSSSFAWTYAIATFYVGTSGIFSATSTTSPVVNTTWILSGTFSPSVNTSTNPTTPLSAFIVQNFSGTTTASIPSVALTAGQLYSVLVAFNNTNNTFNGSYLITLSGGGCISFGVTNNCLARFTPVSDQVSNGLARTLDQLSTSSTNSASMAAAISTLTNLSDSQRAAAEKRLTPGNSAQSQGTLSAVNTALSSVTNRLDSLRNAGSLAWAEPDERFRQFASAGPIDGLLAPRQLRLGAWGRILGGQLRQDAMDGYSGVKANTWGVTLGGDRRLDSGTLVGGAFTYTTTNLDQQDVQIGSGSNVKNYQLTGYATHDFGEHYVEGEVSYGRQRYSSHRDTQVTGIASADFSGDVWATRVGTGMPLALTESLNVTPVASLEYQRLSQNGYTETGADALNLKVGKAKLERLRSSVGVRVAVDQQWHGMKVRPSLHANWLHDFTNNGLNTTANFTGGGGTFATPGQQLAHNSANIGANVLFAVKENTAITVSYDLDASRGVRNQTAQLVAQVWF